MLVRITDITYRPLIKKILIKDINATLSNSFSTQSFEHDNKISC